SPNGLLDWSERMTLNETGGGGTTPAPGAATAHQATLPLPRFGADPVLGTPHAADHPGISPGARRGGAGHALAATALTPGRRVFLGAGRGGGTLAPCRPRRARVPPFVCHQAERVKQKSPRPWCAEAAWLTGRVLHAEERAPALPLVGLGRIPDRTGRPGGPSP